MIEPAMCSAEQEFGRGETSGILEDGLDAVPRPSGDGSEDIQDDACNQEQQPVDTGDFATLQGEGPQTSVGSAGHPDSCQACTFYCFTRRGCNRGADCRFCHLTHQSKLQQRREAWKQQQREKRRTVRDRTAAEALAKKTTSEISDGAGGGGGVAIPTPSSGTRNKATPMSATATTGELVFLYSPGQAILAIGQHAEFIPQLSVHAKPKRFRLAATLPEGLGLDLAIGAITGAPISSFERAAVLVDAEMADGRTARASLDLEVVDFTRGGFVIGHIGEFRPDRYMLLLHVPQGNQATGAARSNQGSQRTWNEWSSMP
mmetsp:Transcript_96324/g.272374  ORF Transcript_96324/g.272374 Transcript_96324/m.272374 type:complete len:317 (-) Transcript_96324:98-1048(-)